MAMERPFDNDVANEGEEGHKGPAADDLYLAACTLEGSLGIWRFNSVQRTFEDAPMLFDLCKGPGSSTSHPPSRLASHD